ncbi:MAG: hypothetical protein QOD86_2159 [Miltoncostaeaceae bacterium]|jgi:uncharacterized OsmC-like protein|nr:hypothetical protein [Miltoncostaeaceae bacterium]
MAEREEPFEYATWSARWKGGMQVDLTARGHHIRVDEPPEFGGTDTGPMPTEMLTAALASCMCLATAWAARKRRVELPDLEVRVLPVREPDQPRYHRYEITVLTAADPEAMEKVLDLAKRWCWVTNTLHNAPELVYRLSEDRPFAA